MMSETVRLASRTLGRSGGRSVGRNENQKDDRRRRRRMNLHAALSFILYLFKQQPWGTHSPDCPPALSLCLYQANYFFFFRFFVIVPRPLPQRLSRFVT